MDAVWNCIPTVYSVVMDSFSSSNQDFSFKAVVKGVWGGGGVAPETTSEAEKTYFFFQYIYLLRNIFNYNYLIFCLFLIILKKIFLTKKLYQN